MHPNVHALGAIALWASLASLGVALRHVPPFLLTGLALVIGSVPAWPLVRHWRVPPRTLALGIYGLFGFHFLLFIALRLAPPVEANLVNYLWPLFIVVLAPVFTTMFGSTTELPRRLVVAVVVVVPVFVATARGLAQVAPVHHDLMTALAATPSQFSRFVRLPGAVPYIMTGLRLAAPASVIAAIVAEYFGGLQNGLGSRITSAASNTAYARAWAYVVGAVVLGLLFYLGALLVERVASPLRTLREDTP